MNLTLSPRYIAVAAVVALGGCVGSSGAPGTPSVAAPQSIVARSGVGPAVCTPKVWASSLGTYAVYGYTAASSAPCVTLIGPYNGLALNAPITVAISKVPKRLYVADLGNNRIVVFTYQGAFVKSLSTALNGQLFQPWGVCVSPRGVVGVANRQFNNSGPPGNVEFFPPNAPNNSTATGSATGLFQSDQFCAFDRKGNFYVDGTTSGGQKIAYLARAYVNLPGQTLVDSGLGTGSFWVGMYSRINNPANQTLSVGTSVGSSPTETVANWKVSGPAVGPLTFSPLASYSLTSYPPTTDAVYQLAPTTGGGSGTLYVADYGNNTVLDAAANGGAVAVYNGVSGTVGVATRPTGQY
ncbi:MAG: hypothetical protein WA814_12270 [Candidatus Baltobacteraceae bacterium]